MNKCKFETSNGRCGLKDCYAYRHKCFTKELCKCHQPMTVADYIRNMTDEEMADYQSLFGHRSGKKMNTHWMCFMKLED